MEDVMCIPNIGPKERRRRLYGGFIGLAAGVVFAITLLAMGAAWWTRLVLFLPFAGGMSGVQQAREKT